MTTAKQVSAMLTEYWIERFAPDATGASVPVSSRYIGENWGEACRLLESEKASLAGHDLRLRSVVSIR